MLYDDGGLHLAADNVSSLNGVYLSGPGGLSIRNTVNASNLTFFSTIAGSSYINSSGGNVGIGRRHHSMPSTSSPAPTVRRASGAAAAITAKSLSITPSAASKAR